MKMIHKISVYNFLFVSIGSFQQKYWGISKSCRNTTTKIDVGIFVYINKQSEQIIEELKGENAQLRRKYDKLLESSQIFEENAINLIQAYDPTFRP